MDEQENKSHNSRPARSARGANTRNGKSRREFIKDAALAGAAVTALPHLLGAEEPARAAPPPIGGSPPLAPAPGPARPWMADVPVYSGAMNLATGNLQIAHPVCGWGGKGGGLHMAIGFNSQSGRNSALGPKWSHSFLWYIVGTNPAVVVAGDGTETSYSLSSGQYAAPAGVFDTLVKNPDNTWTLTRKGGTQYRFRTDGYLGSIVDLNGNTITLNWSGGLLTQVTDAAGRVLALGYTAGKLTSITDAESRVWTLGYDASNRVNRVTYPLLNGSSYFTQFGYGANNNLTSITNRLNKTWQFDYGANSVLFSMTDPDTKVWQFPYASPFGGGVRAPIQPGIWPSGTVSIGQVTDPTGVTTKYGLDSIGCVLAILDGSGSQTNLTYDAANNLTSRTLPSGVVWQYAFDSRGNRLSETDPLNKVTRMTYDAGDRLLTVTDPMNHTTSCAYDSRGNQATVTDATGKTTQTVYNADGSPSQVIDPAGKITNFGYDLYGNRTQITDPLNNVTAFAWANTKLTQRTDANGRVTGYQYDAWGRPTQINYPAGGSASISLSSDAEGRLTQSVDGTGSRTYSYDSWGRRIAMTDPRGNMSANYDAAGRLLSQTDASGRLVQYGYDGATRMTQVADPTTSATYGWTVDGNIAVEVYPNGTRKEVTYDDARRVSGIIHRVIATGAVIVSYAATYDDAGRLTQVAEQVSGDVTTFSYDDAGRILTENRTGQRAYASQYAYDSRGGRAAATRSESGVVSHNGTYSYDNAGRLTQVVDAATNLTETYAWNPDGTLASSPGPGYTRRYEYDEEQRLVRIRKDFGGGNVQTAYEYGYAFDGGRRWRKDYAANQWTWYPCGVACGAGELVEQQSDLTGGLWTTTALYLKGLSIVRRNSEYHHFDLLGAAGIVTDPNGAVVSNNLYDSFGVQRFMAGSAATPARAQIGCAVTDDLLDWLDLVVADGSVAFPSRALRLVPQRKTPTACDRNKSNPSAVNCQDCCDEYLIDWLKGKIKKGCKEIVNCIRSCEQQYPNDPSPRLECIRGCVGPGGGLSVPVKQFLECCYSRCLPSGNFNPPGPCKLK